MISLHLKLHYTYKKTLIKLLKGGEKNYCNSRKLSRKLSLKYLASELPPMAIWALNWSSNWLRASNYPTLQKEGNRPSQCPAEEEGVEPCFTGNWPFIKINISSFNDDISWRSICAYIRGLKIKVPKQSYTGKKFWRLFEERCESSPGLVCWSVRENWVQWKYGSCIKVLRQLIHTKTFFKSTLSRENNFKNALELYHVI